ncbi:hypothetical protein HanIR_Chr14g0685651 [Helianthus annuus]|nr:hypothetical protein HanIR_Chr14g0685651 [Helianthus annuus]
MWDPTIIKLQHLLPTGNNIILILRRHLLFINKLRLRHVEGTSKRLHTNVQAQIHSKLLKGTQKVGPRTKWFHHQT